MRWTENKNFGCKPEPRARDKLISNKMRETEHETNEGERKRVKQETHVQTKQTVPTWRSKNSLRVTESRPS